MAPLILDCLSKAFAEAPRPAVDAVSLTIEDGRFLALLGPSGCGKTTILRLIAGFEAPTGGRLSLGPRLLADATRQIPPEGRNMAMVFQSYALWPHLSVAENVGYPLKIRRVSAADYQAGVRAALQAVRLEAFADRRPADLSGGQRQRVALARCLVTRPAVVLLDEPLANLDRHLRQEMEETFRQFHQRSGAILVYVTHDQGEAMALAGEIAVMGEGRLLQRAAPADLYARPDGRLVGGLIGRGRMVTRPVTDPARRAYDWAGLHPLLTAAPAGTAADLLIRPEDVLPDPAGLPAVVEQAVFEGERFLLTLRLTSGDELLAYSRQPVAIGTVWPVIVTAGWRL